MYTALLKVLCYSMVAKAFAQPSSHANSIAIVAMLSCHAVLPCCPPMLSSHAVLPCCPASPTMREGMPINAMNDINIPLPMLYICFSTNYKPFAMLLPLCGLVLLFCCTFFKASFNSASIAPIAELYRSLLCHLSGHHSIAIRQGITASPFVMGGDSIANSNGRRQHRQLLCHPSGHHSITASPSVRASQHR